MLPAPASGPKDYAIKDVTKSLQSSSQFTPGSQPRVSQPNLGKFCFPIEYKEDEFPDKVPTVDFEPVVMEKMTKDERASWVIPPGKDDFFLHNLYRKYSFIKDHKSFDPRYMHKERVFNRSYRLEMDCLRAARLNKLVKKCERENEEFENSFQELVNKQKQKEKPRIQVQSCQHDAPFWWKDYTDNNVQPVVDQEQSKLATTTYKSSYVRWQEEPNLTAFVKDDPCRRKYEMNLEQTMEKIATENLFLLEFLVDNVNLDPQCDCSAAPGETCVSFQFLDNAPLDVCEADFNPQRSYKSQNDDVKSGKSCLFSLSPDQAIASTQQFDIFVTIFKKMQPGWLPEKVDVGAALISISNLFNELISSVETADGTNPTAKTLKDNFDITNPAGQVIGKIGVYIRMSCFGKLIVTQFQMNLNDKSVLFKDKEGKSLYRYKKAGKGKKDGCTTKQQQPSPQQRYNSTCPTSPCAEGVNQMSRNQFGASNQMQTNQFGGGMQPNSNCPFSPCIMDQGNGFQESYGQQALTPCSECGARSSAPCYPPSNQGGMMNMGYPPPPSSGMMTPCIECGNLPFAPCMPPQAGVGGNYGEHPNTPCEECGNMPDAPCAEGGVPDEGNYQEIGASMGGNSLTIRVHKDKNKVEQVDPNATFVSESSEGCACLPGRPGKKKKMQQVLNMGPGVQQGNQNIPFSFKMGRNGDSGDNNVVVNPPVTTRPDGAQFTEFSDPNKELFILRIGKKSEGVDKKQNLELELCTPKGPELKPIPKKETRDTQYDPADAGPETDGKKGKKSGKEKGGKKKK